MTRPIAMVTGSNRNTGLGIIRHFAKNGYDVIAACRSQDKADETVKMLETECPDIRVSGVWFDQSRPEEIHAAFQLVRERFGRLDALICNATVTGRQTFLEITPDEMNAIMLSNVNGYLFCAQEAAKLMIPQHKGSIVMISSIQSKGAVPHMMAYAASKAAINSISRSIALETARYGIRCNVVLAGAIHVDKWETFTEDEAAQKRKNWPLERESTPQEIAEACLYLASERSATVTGTEMTVDSGLSMCLLPYNREWK